MAPARSNLKLVPMALATALVVFAGAYWGLHALLYGADGNAIVIDRSTHSFDPDRPHPVSTVR